MVTYNTSFKLVKISVTISKTNFLLFFSVPEQRSGEDRSGGSTGMVGAQPRDRKHFVINYPMSNFKFSSYHYLIIITLYSSLPTPNPRDQLNNINKRGSLKRMHYIIRKFFVVGGSNNILYVPSRGL